MCSKAEGARKLSWKERKELDEMERAIEAAEARWAELEARLADPALYAEPADEVVRVTVAFRDAGEAVEALYARWAALEEIAAGA